MPRIVIIGAGPAGTNAMLALAKHLKSTDDTEVVVLEKNDYYYHAIGAPRAYTEATFAPKIMIPYDNAIPAAARGFVKLLRGIATAIDGEKNEVSYKAIGTDSKPADTTETLTFDYLIVATGSTYTTPIKPSHEVHARSKTEAQLQEVREQIAKADRILIVGGGAVGCEVAGDIAAKYPNKSVTILEGRDKLIAGNNLKDKFRNYLTSALDKLKIKVIVGERLEERLNGNVFEKRVLKTNKGTEIESDIQLLCGGFHPVAELVQAFDASLVDERGSVKVNGRLQLDNSKYHHIFALGDVSNHATPKLAYWAGEQAKFVANELVAIIRKKHTGVTKDFPLVTVEALILPLGPNGGVSQLPVMGGSVVGDTMTRMVKAKGMFAAQTWTMLGTKMPQ